MSDYEVAIAGAGPAGIACAVALVRRAPSLKGRVVVFDRARFPRDKPCGGGLTGHVDEALAALGLELCVPSAPAPRGRVTFGAVERTVTLARPVRVVARREFDASLVAQARDLGVEVREGEGVDGFQVQPDHVELGAGGRAVRARVLVGADGAGSSVRKALRGERRHDDPDAPRGRPIRLFRLEQKAPPGAWPDDTMLYDFTPMAEGLRGYVWVFPMPGGRINVGLMHDPGGPARSGAELTALLGRHLARLGIALEGAPRGWPAWGYDPQAPVAAPRLLLVGDAAGIDALTGEGIAVGLEEGPLAAAAITDALDRGDFGFAGWRRTLRRATVGRELTMDRRLAWLLYGGERWRSWLPLVLYDERMLELYAARVCGSLVLADQWAALVGAFLRHLVRSGPRRRLLEREARLAPAALLPPPAAAAG